MGTVPAALAAGLGFMQRASRTPHIMDPGVVAASAAPLGALLSDFSTALDATEWTLLFAAMGFSVSLAAFMVTVLVICIVPTPPSHMWMWRYSSDRRCTWWHCRRKIPMRLDSGSRASSPGRYYIRLRYRSIAPQCTSSRHQCS